MLKTEMLTERDSAEMLIGSAVVRVEATELACREFVEREPLMDADGTLIDSGVI